MSVEIFEGFQFRYCWDIDHHNTIRIYVEKRPTQTRHLRLEDICLHQAKDGAPEYINIPEGICLSIFTEAQSIAHEWAKRVIKGAMSKSTPATVARGHHE